MEIHCYNLMLYKGYTYYLFALVLGLISNGIMYCLHPFSGHVD